MLTLTAITTHMYYINVKHYKCVKLLHISQKCIYKEIPVLIYIHWGENIYSNFHEEMGKHNSLHPFSNLHHNNSVK